MASSPLFLINMGNQSKEPSLRIVKSSKKSPQNQHTAVFKHKNLILSTIWKIGPASLDRIFHHVQQRISNLGTLAYPLRYGQFRNQVQILLKKGLIVRNGHTLQVKNPATIQVMLKTLNC